MTQALLPGLLAQTSATVAPLNGLLNQAKEALRALVCKGGRPDDALMETHQASAHRVVLVRDLCSGADSDAGLGRAAGRRCALWRDRATDPSDRLWRIPVANHRRNSDESRRDRTPWGHGPKRRRACRSGDSCADHRRQYPRRPQPTGESNASQSWPRHIRGHRAR